MHRGIFRCEDCPSVPVVKSEREPEMVTAGRPRVELPLDELEQALRESAGQARRVTILDCKSCGAQVETPVGKGVSECLFCGRKTVLEEQASQTHGHQVFIPFRVNKSEAVAQMKSELGSLWLRPGGLAGKITEETVRKVYLPFWCYDVSVTTEWQGTTQVWEEPGFWGKLFGREGRYRTETVSGFRTATYDDWLVCASKGLQSKLVRGLEPFDTEGAELRRLDDELDGTAMERGTTTPRLGWSRAQVEIRASESDACHVEGEVRAGARGGSGVDVKGFVEFGSPKAKAAILPLYVFSRKTAYGSCVLAVNGETGKCAALVPYSYLKLVPAALMLLTAFGIGVVVSGGLLLPALGAYYLYKWWKGRGTVEQRAAKFPARF